MRALNAFQCSRTSRVGVNGQPKAEQPASQKFQCSRTSRVGVNYTAVIISSGFRVRFSALGRAVLGSIVAVTGKKAVVRIVSVLSDEPCWGQCLRLADLDLPGRSFSALGRAVLGSIRPKALLILPPRSFSALGRAVLGSIGKRTEGRSGADEVSVLSDEPCWGQYGCYCTTALYNAVSVLSDEPCWGQ